MALQLFKIASVEVATPQASIDFSSIPSGYTDLILKTSLRSARTGPAYDALKITVNGSTTGYTNKDVYGYNGSVGNDSNAYTTAYFGGYITSDSATASCFANLEAYFPNYTSSNYKSMSSDVVSETNSSLGFNTMVANLWSNTSAITSMSLVAQTGNFLAGTTATLYGVL